MDETLEVSAAPNAEAVTPETEPNPVEHQTQELDAPPLDGAPEFDEVEEDGEKYKIPAKLKAKFEEYKAGQLRQADYTRKTQEVAETRRTLEQQAQQQAQYAQTMQQHLQDVAKIVSIDDRLEQFKKLDWDAITQADPVQAMTLDRQMRQLESEKQTAAQRISEGRARAEMETQQATVRRLQEAEAELARDIKGWSPDVKKALVETGKSFGYRPEELTQITDPRAVKLLWEAHQYRQLKAKQTAPNQPPAQPSARVTSSRANAVTDPDKMTTAEWLKWRNSTAKR